MCDGLDGSSLSKEFEHLCSAAALRRCHMNWIGPTIGRERILLKLERSRLTGEEKGGPQAAAAMDTLDNSHAAAGKIDFASTAESEVVPAILGIFASAPFPIRRRLGAAVCR